MLAAVGRYFIVLIDKRGHTNAPFSRTACGGCLRDRMEERHSRKQTPRAVSVAIACYVAWIHILSATAIKKL